MIGSAMGYADDVFRFGWRGVFRKSPGQSMAYDPANPGRFFTALKSGNKQAINAMEKMHYGSFYGEGRTVFSGLAERELKMKGAGFSGALFGRPMKGLGVGLSHLKGQGYFAAAAGAFEAFTAKRGHKLSGAVGGVARTLTFAAGDVIGSMVGGPLAGIALGSLFEHAGGKVGDAMQFFSEFHHMIHHVNMGGNYEDTRMAYTMRQRAAQEMGGSVMNARSWLGKEGALMHQ